MAECEPAEIPPKGTRQWQACHWIGTIVGKHCCGQVGGSPGLRQSASRQGRLASAPEAGLYLEHSSSAHLPLQITTPGQPARQRIQQRCLARACPQQARQGRHIGWRELIRAGGERTPCRHARSVPPSSQKLSQPCFVATALQIFIHVDRSMPPKHAPVGPITASSWPGCACPLTPCSTVLEARCLPQPMGTL